MLEISFIERYNPRFNFTKGGDGCTGRKCSIETRKKISEANTGKKHSDETKQKISENITRYWEGKTRPNESKIKMSEAHNTSGYYNVTKQKNKQYKRGFIWRYTYYEDGKQKTITSVSLEKLEQKVKARELKWLKIETEENQ